jgi:hypothetical protein
MGTDAHPEIMVAASASVANLLFIPITPCLLSWWLQNPVFAIELLLQETGLGAAISSWMRVIEANIGRPEWMLRNALDYGNGGF